MTDQKLEQETLEAEEQSSHETGKGEGPEQEKLHARLALGVRDRDLAEQHAAELVRRGFDVVRTAARGVSFEGDPELFQSTFESEIEAAESPRFGREPKLPEELRDSVESVYFPTRPTFHGKERRR